jgi:LAO/AO transport system kinase
VLLVSALTGAGVPGLLAALDRRDAVRRDPARAGDRDTERARSARAEAQLQGILAERVRERLHDAAHGPATADVVRAIASHEIDPYAAADQLLASLMTAVPR